MSAYYNEIDAYAAQWLRNLISAGLIAPGDVDERSIADVPADDLRGYTQCHFFAGIGGWSLAARLAGWPDDQELWTGSCPCQPFSVIGKRGGAADERHLWPVFADLIRERRPSKVFGEQVASADGRTWLAGVRADLEGMGYRVGAADLCAAGIGAPHIRQRLYWVADTDSLRFQPVPEPGNAHEQCDSEPCRRLVYADDAGLEGHAGHGADRDKPGRQHADPAGSVAAASGDCWQGVYIPCADGKARRIEPGLEPLAYGIPGRVGRLRAYGNAIVPQLGAEFMSAFMECMP